MNKMYLLRNSLYLLQNDQSVFQRIWSWVNHPFTIGNFSISLTSLALGALTLLLAVIVSRSVRSLIHRRLERHPKVDPGLQYTLLRVLHYIIIVTGSQCSPLGPLSMQT